jgi:hypothetical protein
MAQDLREHKDAKLAQAIEAGEESYGDDDDDDDSSVEDGASETEEEDVAGEGDEGQLLPKKSPSLASR